PEHIGMGKGIGIGDINRDGKNDLVLSFEQATGDKSGLVWLSAPDWKRHEISGTAGTKYDVIKLVDLDGDGDLDVISTEEMDNVGVIWFENPTIKEGRSGGSPGRPIGSPLPDGRSRGNLLHFIHDSVNKFQISNLKHIAFAK